MPAQALYHGRKAPSAPENSHRINNFEIEEFLNIIKNYDPLSKYLRFIYFESFKSKEYICGENQLQLFHKFDSLFNFEFCDFLDLDVNVSATPRTEVPLVF